MITEYNFFELYNKLLTNLKSGRKRLPNGNLYQAESIKNYEYVLKNLMAYCEHKKSTLRIKSIKRLGNRELMREKNYWKKFYKSFSDYMHKHQKHNDNYVGMHMKVIRSFFNYLNNDLQLNVGNFHKQFHVYKEDIPIVVLSPEQVNFMIYNIEFENSLPSRLQKVKDILVFGCTVALRYSDLKSLTRANILKVNNHYYLAVRSKKTKTYTRVLLPDYAVGIIRKYKLAHKQLLPVISNFNFNKYVRELAQLAGWTQPVGKYREKQGVLKEVKKEQKRYRFCDLISAHTMRRTAITTMLTLDVPEHIVRSVSGHSPMSKEFFRYVSIAQVYKDREMDKMYNRLKAAV